VLYRNDVEANLHVCPKCDHHMRIGARERLDGLLDPEGRYEIGQEIVPVDALKFKDSRKYPDRLKEAMDDTDETDAMVVMGGASTRCRWWSRASSSRSWAARWVRWSASVSRAARRTRSNRKCRSSASPLRAARDAGKPCSR
jgi:Acetyl-CoA carboxylase beta subunit